MRRWVLPSPVHCIALLGFISCTLNAIDVQSLLNNGQLSPEWKSSLGAKTTGSIAPAHGGLLLQSEARVHGLISRETDAVGSDSQPLDVLVQLATLHESERSLMPGLFLYWDDANYTGLRLHHEGHVWGYSVAQSVAREQHAWGVLKNEWTLDGKKWKQGWLRIRLLSRTALLSYSSDGIEWMRIFETGVRPGPSDKAPQIIIGRGTALDSNNKDAKPGFANDVNPDGNKTLVKTLLLQFRAASQVAPIPDLGAFNKQDTWEETLVAMESSGLPRPWTFAGPALKSGQRKTFAAPDQSDEWKELKDPDGQPIKTVAWTRPDEEHSDGLIDLSEHLGQTTGAAGWARTEIQWPVDGEALLWYSSANAIALYVNNQRVLPEREESDHRAREKRSMRIWLNKGRNVIKARCWQSRGDWSFSLRVERNDPGYRIALLEKLIELFPGEAQGWRAAAAYREIARAHEEIGDYTKAVGSYVKMQTLFASVEEHRLNAFLGQIRLLELLRDGPALKAAGEAFLSKHPAAPGSIPARRAVLLGCVLAGDTEGAFKAAAQFAEQTNGENAMAAYRALAGAFHAAGALKEQSRALMELASLSKASSEEQIRAALENAFNGWTLELQRGDRKHDAERCKNVVQSFEKAFSLIAGGKTPMAQSLAQTAAEEAKAERFDAAMSGYWGACLLALAASDPDLAPLTAFSKARTIQRPEKENNNPINDANQLRRVLTRAMQEQLGDALPLAKWRVVAFNFENQQSIQTPFGPEQNPNGEDYGNNRRWQNVEVDLENDWELFRGNSDQGIELNRWAENADVAYVQRDFEVKVDGEPNLFVAAPGGWAAWIDGKPVGSNLVNKGFRIDKDRVPLKLSAGKHRLVLKLEAPQSGSFNFRARIAHEPELATYLYVQAQMQLAFPRTFWERRRDLGQLIREYLPPKIGVGAATSLYAALSIACAENAGAGAEYAYWASDRFKENGEHEAAAEVLRAAVIRIEAAGEFSARSTAAELRRRLAMALVACGQMGAADGVLRELAARYPGDRDYYNALTLRGCLRRDGGQSHTALPFFEEVAREYTNAAGWERQAWQGVEWARNFRPERLVLETPHEIQTALDAVRRQLNAGEAADIERAMRNVSEALQGAGGALSRVADSPFFPRYVGAREFVRTILESLPPATREVYAKVVREGARKRLNAATALNDTVALEGIANEFYFTPEAIEARKVAAGLLQDRGQFAQAASLLQALLRQNGLSRGDSALLLAKLARAQTGNGQYLAAQRSLERLKSELAGEQIPFGGKATAASAVADHLLTEVETRRKAVEPSQKSSGIAATHMANLLRTGTAGGTSPEPGPVVWAHSLIPQSAMAQARGAFDVELNEYASSHVAAANGIAYVSGFESLRAIEIATGRVKWSHAWGSAGPLLRGGYNGYPISAPTVVAGRVYIRALESGVGSIRCYAADSGQLIWSSAASPELRPLAWISEPAVAYGMVFASYIEPGDMNIHGLAALDVQTGRTRWKSAIATGNTGIKIIDRYYMSTLHMGPAAIDAGIVYIATGMSSAAAVDAFSGEIKWLSAYPRLYLGDPRGGQSSAGFDLLLNTAKTFARGPLSPVLDDDTVLVAPKDSANIYCFKRQTGELAWVREFADCRFIAGLVESKLLVCDGGVQAIDAQTGALAWENGLEGRSVVGQPALSGGQLYIPTASALIRVDAKTGRKVGETPWDARVGALGSVTVAGNHVIGTNQMVIAALGEMKAARAELPLYEARELELAGKAEEAVERYKQAMQNKDSAEFFTAFTARLRLLEKLGKKDDIKAMLDELERSGPEEMASFSGLWRIRRDVYLAAIRARVLGVGSATEAPQGGLAGTLVYAGEISGDNALLCRLADNSDRVLALVGNDAVCLKGGKAPEILWRSYAGPGIRELRASGRVVAAMSELRIVLLDSATGQLLGEILPPTAAEMGIKRRGRMETRRFIACAPGDNTLIAVAGELLCAWDIVSSKLLWTQKLTSGYKPTSSEIFISNDRLYTLQPYKDERKNQTALVAYDARSGQENGRIILGPRGWGMQGAFSPDGARVAYRCENRIICADTHAMKILWNIDGAPRLESRAGIFVFQQNTVRYSGQGDGRWQSLWFDKDTGKEIRPRANVGASIPVHGEYLSTSGEWGRKISRERLNNGQLETIWSFEVSNEQGYQNHHLLAAYPAQDGVHLLYARERSGAFQVLLRTYGWESGQQLGEQILPGSVMRREDGGIQFASYALGGTVAFTAQEGLFLFTSAEGSNEKIASSLRARLNAPELPAAERATARRAASQLEMPGFLALLAPQELRIDGNHSEWQGMEPIELKEARDYAPVRDGAIWKGASDLSARLYLAWNGDGLALAADVTDNTLLTAPVGEAGASGDGLRIALNSRAEGGPFLDRSNDLAFTLSWRDGNVAITRELFDASEGGKPIQAMGSRLPNGKGYRYEVLIPWELFRREADQRPGNYRDLRLGLAVLDDDGQGVLGQMELGAGILERAHRPQWMPQVTLLDISNERIERYRKTIAQVPDSQEAFRFLELILRSKRGPKAEEERAAELEKFVESHPASPNAARALGILRTAYEAMGEQNVNGKLDAFMNKAKVSPETQNLVLNTVFKVWVYPEAKTPPQTIMVQFARHGEWFRAYWGNSSINFGREGTRERWRMGNIPKPGEWSELAIYPADFGMLGSEVQHIGLASYGGVVYFDRMSITVAGKETVLIDDQMMEKGMIEHARVEFVENPKRHGGKAFVFRRHNERDPLLNPTLRLNDGKAIFAVTTALPEKKKEEDRAKIFQTYREVARLIPDTQEGWNFMQWALDYIPGEGKEREKKKADELKSYLKENPATPNGVGALKRIFDTYQQIGEGDPLALCEGVMQEARLPRDTRRGFYTEAAAVWTEWNVLGPFAGLGERRGMDVVMDPERAVDLKWRTASASGEEVGWTKISNKKDKDGKPSNEQFIDLRRHLKIPRSVDHKMPVFAYAYTRFNVPQKRKALLLFGAKDMVSIWVNGKRVASEIETDERKDRNVQEVSLRSGENEILLKIGCPREQRLGFIFRLADLDGKPFTDISNE